MDKIVSITVIKYILGCLLLMPFLGHAQNVPAPPQTEGVVINNVTLHIGNGKVVERGAIAFNDGKIVYAGTSTGWNGNEEFKQVDGAGKHVYPALIAPNTQVGLIEIGAVRATRDAAETGTYNPHVRSLIAYDTDSEIIPVVRNKGIGLVQVTPQGGRISGTSSIMTTDAWNWEDAAYSIDEGIHLSWPRLYSFNWRERSLSKNKKYGEQTADLKAFLQDAKAYAAVADPAEPNLKMEAMRGLFDGSKQLYLHADEVEAMETGILLAEDMGIERIVVVGGRDSWMNADFLKSHKVPVILGEVQALPARTDYDVDQPFKTPKMLADAGVDFCLSVNGFWQQWYLPYQAGQAVSYGLDPERAIASISGDAAKILGIGDRVGTLEVGKDANLMIGDARFLDIRFSNAEALYIQGRAVRLMEDKQTKLYEKYKTKYGH